MKTPTRNPNNILPRIISEAELKERFGFGTTWLIQRRNSGKLPFIKIGKKVFYREEDVEQFMLNHLQSTKHTGTSNK